MTRTWIASRAVRRTPWTPAGAAPLAALLICACCAATPARGAGLGLPSSDWGLGFGNLPAFTGVRLSLRDEGAARDTGLRLQLLWPRGRQQGELLGVGVGGLGLGARRLRGLGVAGLGLGAESITGAAVAGLGVGCDRLRGVGLAGLGLGCDELDGLAVGGLGIGGDALTGVGVGGLGIGGDALTGVFLGGLGIGGDRLTGVATAGAIGLDSANGAALALGYLRTHRLAGVGTGAYTRVEVTHGVTIGVFNHTRELHGVQIGILNYAGNNAPGLRLLPGINAHF